MVNNFDLNCIKTIGGQAYIEYSNWAGLFANNICNDFVEFILDDTNIIDNFIKDAQFNDTEICNCLKEIDNIL